MDTAAYQLIVTRQGSQFDGIVMAVAMLVGGWAVIVIGYRIAKHSATVFQSRRSAIVGLIFVAALGSFLLDGAWASEHISVCYTSYVDDRDSVTLASIAAGDRLTAACERGNDRLRERYQLALALVVVPVMLLGSDAADMLNEVMPAAQAVPIRPPSLHSGSRLTVT